MNLKPSNENEPIFYLSHFFTGCIAWFCNHPDGPGSYPRFFRFYALSAWRSYPNISGFVFHPLDHAFVRSHLCFFGGYERLAVWQQGERQKFAEPFFAYKGHLVCIAWISGRATNSWIEIPLILNASLAVVIVRISFATASSTEGSSIVLMIS